MPKQRKKPAGAPAPAPAPKKFPQRKPGTGLFSKALMQNLKTMPPGTPGRSIVLEALRAVPPEKIKAALATASANERNLLFGAVPSGEIGGLLGSVPEATLGPATPPPAAPSPVGGPPSSILTTTYQNVPFPAATHDPVDWTKKLTGGKTVHDVTVPPVYEWTPVYDQRFEKEGSLNNPAVGLTGWVVPAKNRGGLSGGDVWFTHPFNFDWEYYVVPDPQYQGLLASTNTGTDPHTGQQSDLDYHDATQFARNVLKMTAPAGVLGVEIDQGLVPPAFRNQMTAGARVATFGRWIVDSGHSDFHTEIHPPLLQAVAKPQPPIRGLAGAGERTHVDFMTRPYTVSQRFPEGNFVDHLIAEVVKVETTIFGIPLSFRVEAHPTVFTTPYDGRPFIKLLVKPPVPRSPVRAQQLTVGFHFTYRGGVAVRVYDAGADTVGVVIVLGDLQPSTLPRKNDWNIPFSLLGTEEAFVVDILQVLDLLFDPFGAYILSLGILTDLYDAPIASSPGDLQNVAGPVGIDQLAPTAGFFEDDRQPFPLYGWLDVWWQDPGVVIE
jgi:hypothetical protein